MKRALVWLLTLAFALALAGGCAPISGRSSLEEAGAALPADSPYAFRNLADMMENQYNMDYDRMVLRDAKTGETLATLTLPEDEKALADLMEVYEDLASDLALSLITVMNSYDSEMGPSMGAPFQSNVRYARARRGNAVYQLDFYCADGEFARPHSPFLLFSLTSYEDNQLYWRMGEKIFADAHNLPGLLEFGMTVPSSVIEDINAGLAQLIESK